MFTIGTFAPVSNLVVHTGVVLADRTLYGPSIGTSLLLGGAFACVARLAERIRMPGRGRVVVRRSILAALAGVAAALAIVGLADTLRTVGVWRDNQSVFTAMRDRSPTSYRSYYMLAVEERKRSEAMHQPSIDAHRDFTTAIRCSTATRSSSMRPPSTRCSFVTRATPSPGSLNRSPETPDSGVRGPMLALLEVYRGETSAARELLRTGVALEPDQRAWRKMLDSLDRAAHTS